MTGLHRTRMGGHVTRWLLIIVLASGLATVPVTTADSAGATQTSVTIYRDEHGVPHVYSDTALGLFEGAGYVTAMRSLAHGRLHIAALCVGMAQRLVHESVGFAQDRSTMQTKPFEPFTAVA